MKPNSCVARLSCRLLEIIKALSLSASLVMLLWASNNSYSQTVPDTKKVVLFFDSDTITPWKREFTDGLRHYLRSEQSEFPGIRIGYEYLGLNNMPRHALPETMIEALEYKQSVDPASVIIATLSPNAETPYEFGDGLIAHIPKVYVLSSGAQADKSLSNDENTWFMNGTGSLVLERTLSAIAGMLPERKNLYVIAGRSNVDRKRIADISTILDRLFPAFAAEFLVGLPEIELLEAVSALPPDSVIYFLTYQKDATETPLNQIEIIRNVVSHTNAPVFSLFYSMYVDGVIGGAFTDPREAGRTVGKMAVAILRGQPTKQSLYFPIVYRFDHRQLKYWGIAKHRLPSNSIIDNETRSIFEAYAKETFAGISALVLLLLLSVHLKLKEKRINRQRNLFESVINSIPDGILLTDKNDRIFDSNTAAVSLFGYSHDELIGMPIGALVERSNAVDDAGRNEQRKPNVDEPSMLTFKKKNGESFPGETIDTKITNTNNGDLGWFCLVRDISKHLIIEEERRQGQKVEALGQLARGISHDFTNILGVIAGYAELARITDDAAFAAENLRKIRKAVDHGKSLVDQIMAFSRTQSISRVPTDLVAVLGDTMKLIKLSIPSNIELEVDAGPDPLAILGSAIQLQQIILNLTINACKAIDAPGGRISISLSQLIVDDKIVLSHGMLPEGKYAVLVIGDTGVGMTTEVASRAFEPFFTTRGSDDGHGMGLTIVYRILKAHGGYINLDTAPGNGTHVAVYFEILDNATEDCIARDSTDFRRKLTSI